MAVKREPPRNININPRDYEKLQIDKHAKGIDRLIAGLSGQTYQDQSSRNVMTPPFRPRLTTADLINQNTASPNQVQPRMPQVPGSNPIQQIMAELQKLMSGNGSQGLQFQPSQLPQFDPDRYKRQAETAVNSQFNPIIQQLLAGQKQTQARAASNRGIVGGLYTGVANEIDTGAAQMQKQYDATQAESKKLYEDERSRIAAGYAADAAAQREEAKRLGIAALGDNGAMAQQQSDQRFADQLGSQQMQSSQAALGQQEAAAGQYNQSVENATRAEGVEAQRDIMRQLEDYMAQSNSDLADTRSQQAGSISDLMFKLASAGYDRDSQNAQFQYQQQRDYLGDQRDLADRQQELLLAQLQMAQEAQQGQGAGSEKLNPWQQTATFAEQLRPGQGDDYVAALQKAMNERGEIYARSRNDTPMNPALFAKLIADYPGNEQLDRNTLMMLSQELYRLLYGMS